MIHPPEKDSLELHIAASHPWWPLVYGWLVGAMRREGMPVVPHIVLTAKVGDVEQRFLLAHGVDMVQTSEPEEAVYTTRWRMVNGDEDDSARG